jgi:hypothetical protein
LLGPDFDLSFLRRCPNGNFGEDIDEIQVKTKSCGASCLDRFLDKLM